MNALDFQSTEYLYRQTFEHGQIHAEEIREAVLGAYAVLTKTGLLLPGWYYCMPCWFCWL